MKPIKGETYFHKGRPVTVMEVGEDGECLVRAGNSSKNLDVWVKWGELAAGSPYRTLRLIEPTGF